MTDLLIDKLDSAIGQILLVSDGETLCALDFAGYESRMTQLLQKRYGTIRWIETLNPQGFSERMQAYLAGDWSSLNDIPVRTGGTPFQQQVWLALRSIPPGTVMTYGQLATRLGHPKAVRAVGMTNSLNPVAIVLPCHRVIGANGKLTGYAGGLERKQWLLQHEGVTLATSASQAVYQPSLL
ncbi:methylated-DNA--[protein]-cysteine S-methyltransferase [Oculatella sp. LEGE 06141]|uniref:methylated-DNA--[protein]-cysteine S-methyltransferase n=1 Tax=Oculatella sp. LEGE 06141 TaxID=1828648 RepID=UPI0018823122|nr:methylated-DNA--[protein]-cysteine S-methyltransferase [Oculatella sp. LEGE 06141]MBE9180456.1 methylated-DNA--[protein]-cysteine S-methyltransferase [Oculatella sp. LEGE 06141]